MTGTRSLKHIETPSELTRSRRNRWNTLAMRLVYCLLMTTLLEVLYDSPLLSMLGVDKAFIPSLRYISLVPVVLGGLLLGFMLSTIPVFRRQRVRAQQALDLEHPDELEKLMRQRYEKSQRVAMRLEHSMHELDLKFSRSIGWAFALLLVSVILIPFSIFDSNMVTYAFVLFGVVYFMVALKHGQKWLNSRFQMREQLELKQDLATIRREIHDDVSGALSATDERVDGAGDLSVAMPHETSEEV